MRGNRRQFTAREADGVYVPAAVAGQARREALEALLALREGTGAVPQGEVLCGAPAAYLAKAAAGPAHLGQGHIPLRARFECVAQLPDTAGEICDTLLLPLFEAEKVPKPLRAQTLLWLPRVLFGPAEEKAAAAIAATREMGFAGYEANNLAHIKLLQGQPVSGGFGLNVTNSGAALQLAGLGCGALTLSPELSLAQMRQLTANPALAGGPATDALCYGHLPLFLTRACPLKQVTGCEKCERAGVLLDRKGEAFPLLCRDGVRSAHNPVPLWMADRLQGLPTNTATLYFTAESRQKAEEVLAAFAAGLPAKGPFTRGLYSKGSKRQA